MLTLRNARRRWSLVMVASAALCSFAGTAAAQERDPAAAQALFDQARDLIRQRRFADACPKLQESNRLDPGIGTQFHLADCYEQSGKVASAWAAFLEVVSQARASNQSDREKAAQKRAEKLEPRLPRLIVTVPDSSKVPGLEVRRNGALVGSATWGTPLPVDPGEVEISASAPGKQASRQTLMLEEAKTATFTLTALSPSGAEPVPTAPVVAPAAAAPAPSPVPPPSDTPEAKSGGNGALILTLAGVGVVGVGVGTAFVVMAKNKYDESKQWCAADNANSCDQPGVDARDSARSQGNIATVAFAVGGAALAGSVIVWLTSGKSEEKQAVARKRLAMSPVLLPGHASLNVEGSF